MWFTDQNSRPVGAEFVGFPIPSNPAIAIRQGYGHEFEMTRSVFNHQAAQRRGLNGNRFRIGVQNNPASFAFPVRAIHKRSRNHAAWTGVNDACFPIMEHRFHLRLAMSGATVECKSDALIVDEPVAWSRRIRFRGFIIHWERPR